MAKITRSGAGSKGNGATPPGELNANSSMEDINRAFAATQLPEGYTIASSFGVTWNHFHMPVLIGTVDAAGVRLIETNDPNSKIKGKTRWSQKVTIITEDGECLDVWESASLKDWFKRLVPHAEVAVVFQGVRPSKTPGKAPLKMFVGSFKGGDLPEVRANALPDDFDGSYNYYAPAEAPPPPRAPRPTARAKR